jgi:glycogen operon protein
MILPAGRARHRGPVSDQFLELRSAILTHVFKDWHGSFPLQIVTKQDIAFIAFYNEILAMTSPAEDLLSLITSDFEISRGSPLPFGATVVRDGINFAVFSRDATFVVLVLFAPNEKDSLLEIPLDVRFNRTGDIWHVYLRGLDPGIQYGYRMDRDPNSNPEVHRYDPELVLLDPWTRAISGHGKWGAETALKPNSRRSIIIDNSFDWEQDQPLNIPLSETIIYEMHVRGFTRDPSSGAQHPGTFAGLIEKIPYLRDLGITAVELLPVHEFEEVDTNRINPFNGERLINYWGYQPISFFAPNAAYSSRHGLGDPVREFKELVKQLHAAGIEVILDVVFNHTAEGDERGSTFSFRGIDNAVYYMIDPQTGKYIDFSGCGNTLNCNHPVVRELITECLRYWVMEMHVDGFRFDLASILGRGQDGSVLESPPLLEMLAHDPVLANTKLIAEAWDAAGLYQVGTFPAWSRWAEWNGRFRDDIRRFVKGDPGMVSALATRLMGSPDLYRTSSREPYHSINFVTCHDGFTLADLVSYNEKHNWMNGEHNRDGMNENLSWNCGVEGPTDNPVILDLRRRQMKNFLTILLIADGVPMLLGGDELGRTQMGNNNAYCQDNEISWMNWRLEQENASLLRFVRLLIAFRRKHPLLRSTSYGPLTGPGRRVEWHGVKLHQPDWSPSSRTLAMHLSGLSEQGGEEHIYFMANSHWEGHLFQLPDTGLQWRRFVDTSLAPPDDVANLGDEMPLIAQQYGVGPRSVVVLIGRRNVLPIPQNRQNG